MERERGSLKLHKGTHFKYVLGEFGKFFFKVGYFTLILFRKIHVKYLKNPSTSFASNSDTPDIPNLFLPPLFQPWLNGGEMASFLNKKNVMHIY